jgi:DNA polymerase III sliding clamp (beta) subunit (PCNA family)
MKKGKMLASLKKVVSTKDSRPILKYIHYSKDGKATATDSHALLQLDNANPTGTDFLFEPNLFEIKEQKDVGSYPDTSRLIPKEFESNFTVSADEVFGLANQVKAIPKGWLIGFEYSENHIKAAAYDRLNPDTKIELSIPVETSGDAKFEVTINAQLFKNAITFFSDYLENTNEVLTIGYLGQPLRPVLFSAKDAKYLVTPVRVF